MADVDQNDEEHYVPLVDQRVFGAGLKRKRIAFVPAISNEPVVTSTSKASNTGNRYLSIVMQKKPAIETDVSIQQQADVVDNANKPHLCSICGHRLSDFDRDDMKHNTSIAHQLCMEHSHPPSHLDRSRIGLRYLQERGWDPDARKGLGSNQEGIRIPIKAKEKKDSTGLGLLTTDTEEQRTRRKKEQRLQEPKATKLNAKEVRKIEEEKGRRAEKLRQAVYGEDLSQYLGSNG